MKRLTVLAAAVALAAAPAAFADAPADALDKAPSSFAKHDGHRVHYKSLGRGETALVFVHGWTCDLTFWRAQVPAFDGKVRLILIDLPGHGQSDKPKTDYTMDLFARAVEAVLTDAGVKEAALAGHSMGTPVVRQFYRLFPARTRALIAVDGSLRPFQAKPEDIEQFLSRLSGPDSRKTREQMINGMFTGATTAEVRKAIKDTMLSAPQHVAASAMRSMIDPAIWKTDEIKVPLQAIMAPTPNWTGDYEGYVRKLAPRVDYRVMDGVGHFLMMEKPAAFNELLAGFLTKNGLLKP